MSSAFATSETSPKEHYGLHVVHIDVQELLRRSIVDYFFVLNEKMETRIAILDKKYFPGRAFDASAVSKYDEFHSDVAAVHARVERLRPHPEYYYVDLDRRRRVHV